MWLFGWKLKTYIKDRTIEVQDEPDLKERRRHLLDIIDQGGFQKLVVFNGFIGLFAGAYQIFAMALTLPFIQLAYYSPLEIPSEEETLLRTAILLGALVGQLTFGFLSDIYGRRKLYGYELMVLLLAIVGVSTSSPGLVGSMSLFGWLFVWRLIMGFGIGADYPLSATISTEFAPRVCRARMISTVFYAQPLGYLFAGLVTIWVLSSHRNSIPDDPSTVKCDVACRRALDQCWRIIVGVGVVLVLPAIYFRRTIPESPMYTVDVLNRPEEAEDDIASLIGLSMERRYQPEGRRHPLPTEHTPSPGSSSVSPPDPNEIELTEAGPSGTHLSVPVVQGVSHAVASDALLNLASQANEDEAATFGHRWKAYWISFNKYFITEGHWPTLGGVSVAWLCFDTTYYALLGSSASSTAPKIWHDTLAVNCTLPAPWNGTNSTTSYILTFPFVGDPLNCKPGTSGIYSWLMSTAAEVLLLVCAGSVIGGASMIYLIQNNSPRRIQATGFLSLFFIFFITGVILAVGSTNQAKPGASIMFFLASMMFQFGPNFTTFMLPVELFPTKHRAFAHGIAAAAGKAGASLFQVYIQYAKFGNHVFQDLDTVWLGYTILCFMPAMLLGFIVTVYLIPETRKKDGSNQDLEYLQELGGNSPPPDANVGRTHGKLWASSIFLPRLERSR